METIINYKLREFLQLENLEEVENYIAILELLNPIESVEFEEKYIQLKQLKELSFGNVNLVRENLLNPTIDSVMECVELVSGLDRLEIFELPIIDFYSILSGIKEEVIEISNMEQNELISDDSNWEYEQVNSNQRLAKFGILNTINSLANDDVTKWEVIENLNYMVVFTKLKMDKERAQINKEVNELLRKKQKA